MKEESFKLLAITERAKAQMDKRERSADETRKDLEVTGVEADQLVADQVQIEISLKRCDAEVKRAQDELQRGQKEKIIMLRKYKRVESNKKQVWSLVIYTFS